MTYNQGNTVLLQTFVLCLCASSTLQYSIDYQSYNNHSMSLTDMYEAAPGSEANCRHQCSQDSRCKSYVIFEDDHGNTTCGLSEMQDYFTAVNCTICSVNVKVCKSESVIYTEFLHGYIGSQQYANFDSLIYNHCEKLCTNDPVCNGFIYNSVTEQCRHVASSSEVLYSNNTDFSFYRKECPSGCSTFGEYFVDISNISTTFFNTFDNTTRKECEYMCNNISECRGYTGDDVNKICALSYSSRNGKLENCATCANVIKQCPVGKNTVPTKKCSSTTYVYHGTNYESSNTIKTFNSSSLALCQSECSNDKECLGFAFNSMTEICELSGSMFPRRSDCSYCSFTARECSDIEMMLGCPSVNYTLLEFGYVTSSVRTDFTGQAMSYQTCKDTCHSDPLCFGFSHQADDQHCVLSGSTNPAWNPFCLSCSFTKKICTTEATTVSTNVPCACSCRSTNQSVDEIMSRRKQELTINTEVLSSTIRKLNCAQDSRTSSSVIGAFGVLILMIVIVLLILPDLITAISFIMRKIHELNKPIVIQM